MSDGHSHGRVYVREILVIFFFANISKSNIYIKKLNGNCFQSKKSNYHSRGNI